uniref:Uncharacterized protein n=1 Tax=Panagrellus redivivus TaxID=6233 RepID=A0A7E4ZQE0_PANRE
MSADLTTSLFKAVISGIVEVFVFAYVMSNCSNSKGSNKTTSTKQKSRSHSKQIQSKAENVTPPPSSGGGTTPVKASKEKLLQSKERVQPPTSKEREQPSSNVLEEKEKHQILSMEPKYVPKKKEGEKPSPKGGKTGKTKGSEFIPDNDLKSRNAHTSAKTKGKTIHTKDHPSDREEQMSSDKMVNVNNASLMESAGSAEPHTQTAGESSTNAIPMAIVPSEASGVEARDKEKGFVEV